MSASPRVAVVGGGLAGLTIARQLNLKSPGASVDVEVFEASARVGGVIESSVADGFVREHAANGVLGSAPGGAADLAADLGISMVPASAAAKKRWILSDGRLCELPSNPLALAKSGLLSSRGKLRLLAEPVRSAQIGEPTVADFFRHRLGDEVHERIVAPFVAGIYAGDTEELSMPAAFPRLSEIALRKGILRGLLGQQWGARKRPSERRSSRAISAPAGGMGAIARRLAEKLTGRLRLEEPVASIGGSSRGVDIVTESGRVEHFDAVVCAVPAHLAAPMFVDADAELAELVAMIPTAGVSVVHLGYRRQDVGHPLDGFGFLAVPSQRRDILGVVFESSIWPQRAPDDCVLVRAMIGGRLRSELLELGDDETVSLAKENVAEILHIRGEPVHENLVRWPRAIAQYTVGHRERLERAEILAAEQGVVLAGASYHGVAVNSVTQDAVRAARRVHEILAAPLMLFVFVLASAFSSACSGAGKSTTDNVKDGGEEPKPAAAFDAGPTEPAEATAFADGYTVIPVSAADSGTIELTVIAPSPPAKVIGSSGATACKTARRGELDVHTLGGVVGAAVWIDGIRKGSAETTARAGIRQTLAECRLEPRVTVVGRLDAALDVVAGSEVARELTISKGRDVSSLEELATVAMTPIGRGYAVPLPSEGVVKVAGDGVDGSWTVVSGTPYIALTGEKGVARLNRVPAGSYTVRVWHPPIRGVRLEAKATVEVKAGAVAKAQVDLTKLLGAIK